VLAGETPITCRPADLLQPEMDKLSAELDAIAKEKSIKLAKDKVDDVLTYALFNQTALKFLENRNNPAAFEPVPDGKVKSSKSSGVYTVSVDGQSYVVEVNDGGNVEAIVSAGGAAKVTASSQTSAAPIGSGNPVNAGLSGVVFKLCVCPGQQVKEGDVLLVLEVMKMENAIVSPKSGQIVSVSVKEGDNVSVGDCLLMLA